MSNEEPSIRNEAQALDEQEAELRQMLGSELEFLVDMVQAGMVAEEFRRSPAGMSVLVNLKQRMQRAILILRDSSKDAEETLNAAYELRIAYAAMDAISGAIEAGKTAADDIDKHTS